jgi:predicted dehydrogenase
VKFFIFGHGSIGKRHQKNLLSLGHEEVTDIHRTDCALICNPTAMHLTTALTVPKLPLFIEKPLSHNLTDAGKIKNKTLLGYCLRFNSSLRRFKQQVNTAKVKSAKIVCKSWLPDWRPGQDYRQSYSAKKALGGGVLLDLSHEIDYALWFFGPVKKVAAKLQNAPELAIETEAIAYLNLEFVSGVNAEIELSYASKKFERYCEIVTQSGKTMRWDYQPNNEMYVSEMKHFAAVVAGQAEPLVTLADGIEVLKIVKTARISQI